MPGLSIVTSGSSGRDFAKDISMRKVKGYTPFAVGGVNTDIDVGDGTITLWDKKGSLAYLPSETELFVSSSSSSDTSIDVTVTGLDGNYVEKTTTTTVTGQAQVSIGGFLTVRSALVKGDVAIGDLYISEVDTLTGGVPDTDSKIKSKVIAGKQITHNGFFTVPAGKFALIENTWCTINGSTRTANIEIWTRSQGEKFVNTISFSLTNDVSNAEVFTPLFVNSETGDLDQLIKEKTDFEIRVSVDTTNSQVFVGFLMTIIDNSELGVF